MSLVVTSLSASALLIIVGISFGVSSDVQNISPKKGNQRLKSTLCIGAAFCGVALAMLLYQDTLQSFEFSGQIERVDQHAEGRGHRVTMLVRVPTGEIWINADGTSPYFRPGQTLQGRYQGVTGHILDAQFLSSNGDKTGVFHGTDTWPPYGFLLIGVFLMYVGYKVYHRDPEGEERV